LYEATETSPQISGNGRYVVYLSEYAVDNKDTNDSADLLMFDLQTHETKTASVDGAGNAVTHVNGYSISDNGRYIAFSTHTIGGTGNDNYVHDFVKRKTTLVSANPDGKPGNQWSFSPTISGDGRYVAFVSNATDLVPGDTNDLQDIFLHERQTGKTWRINISNRGAQANGGSLHPSISRDGRYVVFDSWSNNLVKNDTNKAYDIFMYDRQAILLRRVNVVSHDGPEAVSSVAVGGSFTPAISGDGKAVLYTSDARNLDGRIVSTVPNLYITYNPVVNIPYYDGDDFIDLID